MFELLGNTLLDNKNEKISNFLKGVNSIKIYSTTNNKVVKKMKQLTTYYNTSNGFEDVLKSFSDCKGVKMLAKSKTNDSDKDLVLFIEGYKQKEAVLVLFSTVK